MTGSLASSASCRGCEISPALFEAPRGYSVLGGQREAATRDDDDDLLQFAIQQSLLEAGSEYDQVRPTASTGPGARGRTANGLLAPGHHLGGANQQQTRHSPHVLRGSPTGQVSAR